MAGVFVPPPCYDCIVLLSLALLSYLSSLCRCRRCALVYEQLKVAAFSFQTGPMVSSTVISATPPPPPLSSTPAQPPTAVAVHGNTISVVSAAVGSGSIGGGTLAGGGSSNDSSIPTIVDFSYIAVSSRVVFLIWVSGSEMCAGG